MEQSGRHVVLEPDPEGGYVGVVPDFPGCYSQGETAEEALSNAPEAILLTSRTCASGATQSPDPAGELVRRVAVGA